MSPLELLVCIGCMLPPSTSSSHQSYDCRYDSLQVRKSYLWSYTPVNHFRPNRDLFLGGRFVHAVAYARVCPKVNGKTVQWKTKIVIMSVLELYCY